MKISISELYPIVKVTPCGEYWRLWQEITFTYNGKTYTIPKDFLTDFASIPDFVKTLLFSDKDKYTVAAIIHDYLCRYKVFPRNVCDEIFYEANLLCGIKKYKAYEMWIGVRMGGWYFYYGYGKSEIKKHKECASYQNCISTYKE